MKAEKLRLGMIVYHRDIYQCRQPLKVVGIREDEVELEGDYSGGTHNVVQRSWLPIKGVRRTRNYNYLLKCRHTAYCIDELSKNIDRRNASNEFKCMIDLMDMIFVLTTDITYEDEYSEDWASFDRISYRVNTNNIV